MPDPFFHGEVSSLLKPVVVNNEALATALWEETDEGSRVLRLTQSSPPRGEQQAALVLGSSEDELIVTELLPQVELQKGYSFIFPLRGDLLINETQVEARTPVVIPPGHEPEAILGKDALILIVFPGTQRKAATGVPACFSLSEYVSPIEVCDGAEEMLSFSEPDDDSYGRLYYNRVGDIVVTLAHIRTLRHGKPYTYGPGGMASMVLACDGRLTHGSQSYDPGQILVAGPQSPARPGNSGKPWILSAFFGKPK